MSTNNNKLYKREVNLNPGSSARKLKRGQANLLGGRAIPLNLHALTVKEQGADFHRN